MNKAFARVTGGKINGGTGVLFINFMDQSLILTRYKKSEDIWTSLIAVHGLDLLQVVLCLCVCGRPAT